ncbi:ethylbenzene dehydrogenase-related protein [Acidobacteriota bacterium]
MKSPAKPILIFTILLLVVSAAYFIIVYYLNLTQTEGLEKEKTLTITYRSSQIPLDPNEPYWKNIEPVKIHLLPQNAILPFGTEERDIRVRGVFNDSEIAFLLEFDDATEDRDAPSISATASSRTTTLDRDAVSDRDTASNPDACAILFTPKNSPAAVQMMGYGSEANIWQWSADRDAEQHQEGSETIRAVRELFASGPGTQAPMQGQNVEGKGAYKDGMWTVVFKRLLESRQEGEFAFSPGKDQKIAFARWDGAKKETISKKSVAIIQILAMEKD